MDRIWAESQLNRLLWGASNTTNFSTVSATAPTEMGSTKVQAASNEQLLLFSSYRQQSEGVLGETMRISGKFRRMYIQIKGRTRGYYFPSWRPSCLGCDAYCVNHRSPVMKCGFLIDFCIGCDGGTIGYYKNSSRREIRR